MLFREAETLSLCRRVMRCSLCERCNANETSLQLHKLVSELKYVMYTHAEQTCCLISVLLNIQAGASYFGE